MRSPDEGRMVGSCGPFPVVQLKAMGVSDMYSFS